MVAVVAVDGLAEVNQLCGYDAGDSLLGSLGHTLAQRASVDLTAGRIGGSHLGLLQTPADDRDPKDLIEPIVVDLQRAIDRWVDDRAALGTPSPIVPQPQVGVAVGFGGGTWSDAEVALAVAQGDPEGPASVYFDLSDPRLAGHRRRQRLADELVEALHLQRLPVDERTVAPLDHGLIDDERETWTRLRTRPALRSRPVPSTGDWHDGLAADDLTLAPGLAARLDGHLLARAADLLESGDPRPGGSASPDHRISVPLLGPLRGPLSALGGLADLDAVASLPAGIVLEVEQHHLLASCAGASPSGLAEHLARLGWSLAITDFDGGWAGWSLLDHYPVHHLRPRADLVKAAIAGDATAARLLRAMAEPDSRSGLGWRLAVPAAAASSPGGTNQRLRQLGLTHIEAPQS